MPLILNGFMYVYHIPSVGLLVLFSVLNYFTNISEAFNAGGRNAK